MSHESLIEKGDNRMKKLMTLVLAALLSTSLLGLLTACGTGANDIEAITVGENESNGVNVKVYHVKLKDSVNWAALSEGDREKYAVTGFNEAQKKIAEDGVFSYQISGGTADEPIAFVYGGEKQTMVIYVAGEQVGEVPVEVPER
jgi:hypothetical protein